MVTQPTLTMIVPAKDQEPFVADCLLSLTRQLTADPSGLEVIVVDDGSTDATAAIVDRHRSRIPGLSMITNSRPVGLASARNLGLERATGRYVGFLDADDWLAPGHLDHLVATISTLGVDFVRTDHVQTTHGQRALHRAPESRRDVALDPRESILPQRASTMVDYCYAWAGIFDRRLGDLLRFPEGLFTAEDRAWAWRLHLQAASFAVVGSPGILYRRGTTSSLTQIFDRRQLDFLPSFDMVFDLVAADPDGVRFWPKACRMFLGVLTHHLRRSASMNEEDRARLERGAVTMIDRIPSDVLLADIAESAPERQQTLLPFLPAEAVRLVRVAAA